ncbi:class I SAM-dependent methyltransferase [Prosthecobacter sp.]|uniref:class I SAM-dependent methyltransferase n=1 Tax=Prosthecobacter sp. TaxID=1965333 RepID=UPI002ABCB291|nr:class I SAM-dependent methyltransferase [Prosthecobacter sp.]MDZ4405784.1 class I SAM-dependent methyltransferase [Prosthecobacter sp.]
MVENHQDNEAYELLDSGGGRVLEKLGGIISTRACHAAWWRRKLSGAEWRKAVELKRELKEPLRVKIGSVRFQLSPAGGGVRALAPELEEHWERVQALCIAFAEQQRRPARVLNLFGGAGGITLAAAQAGAAVVHVEGSAEMIKRARDHAAINTLANRDIRWVVDDPVKFAQRERAQTNRYDLIVIDPQVPRDAKRGAFEVERDLGALLGTVSGLLSDKPAGVLLFCRQGAVSPTTLRHLMRQEFSVFGGGVESGELLLEGAEGVSSVPYGAYAGWLKVS